MAQLKECARIEVDQDQIAVLLSYAEQHHMALTEVLRNAIAQYVGSERKPQIGNSGAAIEPISPPMPISSRHPGRDYSSFGSIKRLPDGLEYQNAAREEW